MVTTRAAALPPRAALVHCPLVGFQGVIAVTHHKEDQELARADLEHTLGEIERSTTTRRAP